MTVPSHVDTVTWLASACAAVLVDPKVPKTLRDRLFTFCAQLRDALPLEKALAVDAAEAEAIIKAFVSPSLTLSLTQPDEEIPLGAPSTTSEAQARPQGSL